MPSIVWRATRVHNAILLLKKALEQTEDLYVEE